MRVAGAGKFTKVAGSSSSAPVCDTCQAGFFKIATSPTSMATDACTAHATCKAGEWTQIVGSSSRDTQCPVDPRHTPSNLHPEVKHPRKKNRNVAQMILK